MAASALLWLACCSLICACTGTLSGSELDDGGITVGDAWSVEINVPPLDSGGEWKPPPGTKVYYVRKGGGSSSQCTGLANADYPGSGSGRACAFSHPFFALPPGGKPLLAAGDTLIIGAGSYAMGYGVQGISSCSSSSTWDCHMPPVPSGRSVQVPTSILGEGWNKGCSKAPELYGVERPWWVVNLRGSSFVRLQCLEITDHSSCVEDHSTSLRCNRDSFPHGNWAPIGIRAEDSRQVVLKDVNIHGLAHTGIWAGRLEGWALDTVSIVGNGWVGWDGDLASAKGSSNKGTLLFRRVKIDFNGCGETYPGGKPVGCWGQSAGGYGDGLGTTATGGDWIFEDCRIRHNTSDGLDLLYHQLGGSVTIRRTLAEGNAGNQIKSTGRTVIENSVMVGNCAYFKGQSFTYNVDHCRALGNTLSLHMQGGTHVSLVNSTLYGQGDVLVLAGLREGFSCNGTESITALNNLFVGDIEYHDSTDRSALYYAENCSGLRFKEDYGVVYNVKGSCTVGAHDLCTNPLLGPLSGDSYGMVPKAGSPAIDSGFKVGGLVPTHDYLGLVRPQGKGVDRGAFEVKGQ